MPMLKGLARVYRFHSWIEGLVTHCVYVLCKTTVKGRDKSRQKVWTTRGSNPRPSACKADALPLRQTPNHVMISKHIVYEFSLGRKEYRDEFTLRSYPTVSHWTTVMLTSGFETSQESKTQDGGESRIDHLRMLTN
jgi:hypothetical protein